MNGGTGGWRHRVSGFIQIRCSKHNAEDKKTSTQQTWSKQTSSNSINKQFWIRTAEVTLGCLKLDCRQLICINNQGGFGVGAQHEVMWRGRWLRIMGDAVCHCWNWNVNLKMWPFGYTVFQPCFFQSGWITLSRGEKAWLYANYSSLAKLQYCIRERCCTCC